MVSSKLAALVQENKYVSKEREGDKQSNLVESSFKWLLIVKRFNVAFSSSVFSLLL